MVCVMWCGVLRCGVVRRGVVWEQAGGKTAGPRQNSLVGRFGWRDEAKQRRPHHRTGQGPRRRGKQQALGAPCPHPLNHMSSSMQPAQNLHQTPAQRSATKTNSDKRMVTRAHRPTPQSPTQPPTPTPHAPPTPIHPPNHPHPFLTHPPTPTHPSTPPPHRHATHTPC